MTRFRELIARLTGGGVDFVLVGGLAVIAPRAIEIELYGARVRLLSLEDLIGAKAAAGRAKDLVDLEALRALAK